MTPTTPRARTHTGARTRAIALAIVAALVPLAPGARAQPPRAVALVGGTLIDGHGGPPLRNSVVLVEGERIARVGRVGEVAIPPGAEIISTEGMSVLPGLWDMHVHLMLAAHADYAHWDRTYPAVLESIIMPATARQLLMAGVTSARDLGGPLDASLRVRDAVRAGRLPGPTLYVSGPFIQKAPYPGTEAFRWGVNGPDDARAKVRRLAEAGVNVVKLIDQDQMTMEELRAVVDEAHRRGLPVVAHAHRPDEIRRGLQVGVDHFEHTGLATAAEYPADVMQALRERAAQGNRPPLFWTPTISPLLHYESLRDHPESLDHPDAWAGLPDTIVADIRRSFARPERLAYYQMVPSRRPTLARKFAQLRESGAVLVVGTDAGVPMQPHAQATWQELDAWVNTFGVDPMTAIRAATFWPAVAMRVDRDVGTVAEGKVADIIAVRGDVLRNIGLLQRVDVVVQRGRRVR